MLRSRARRIAFLAVLVTAPGCANFVDGTDASTTEGGLEAGTAEGGASSEDGSPADGSPEDAASADGSSGDGQAGDCVEGTPCTPAARCLRGISHCDAVGNLQRCEQVEDEYADSGTECGFRKVCDGAGNCVPCGALEAPCCGALCEAEALCSMEGRCTACTPGAACRAEACRAGTADCSGSEPSCTPGDALARGASCGSGQACDGEGACEACGAEGQLCCGSACGAGLVCDDATTTCFACSPGAECDTGSACTLGVQECGDGDVSCRIVGSKARGAECGEDLACDGQGECVTCGGDGQPCCGSACGEGLACDATTLLCRPCVGGEACTSGNGCRTGQTQCVGAMVQCVEDASVARGSDCGSGQACDGAGACVACGGSGQPCCDGACGEGAGCDEASDTCLDCAAGTHCERANGCSVGEVECSAGAASCGSMTQVARATPCDSGAACDGEGACVECGKAGQPCCDGSCDEGAACHWSTRTCGSCPDGMVLVAGGTFQMGAETGDASPVHTVSVTDFCLAREEVSVAAYSACGSCSARASDAGCTSADALPANCVSWEQARAYCDAQGLRLPTEAEWEYAARGGSEASTYPWGEDTPSCTSANYGECEGSPQTPGSYAASSVFAVHDLAGNLSEWVADFYDAEFYADALAAGSDPTGPESGSERVVRGGSFASGADALRGFARQHASPGSVSAELGIRCAADLVAD